MARTPPEIYKKDAPFGFFFLVLYTIFIFIRPHEAFTISESWILIKVLAILSFSGVIFALRPLQIGIQGKLLLLLIPVIMISAFANGYGMMGITQSQSMLVGSIIPMFLYSVLLTSLKRHHVIMFICLIAALFMVHNGHIQRSSPDGYGWTGTKFVGEGRITYLGFFSDPNDIGLFLVMCMPITTYFISESKKISKLFYIITLAALFYGVYLTDSRGTFLGVVGVIGSYLLLTKGGTKLIIFVLTSTPILATLVASRGGMSSEDASANGRLEAWYSGLHEMFLSNPILGIGKGNFVDFHGRAAHNSFVLVTGELGFLGYSLWGGALFCTVICGYFITKMRTSKLKENLAANNSEEKNILIMQELKLATTLFFSMVAFMITAFFLSRSYVLVLFVFLGLNIAAQHRLLILMPELTKHLTINAIIKAIIAAWLMIVLVYITLKIA